MAIPSLTVTENWASLEALTSVDLSTAMTSIETYCNTNVKLNFEQIALDVFGASYEYNNDGIATRLTALIDSVPDLDSNQTINGAWTFDSTVAFSDTVTATSLVNMTGQNRCKAYRATSAQSIPDVTLTAVSMNAEVYDVGEMHDNSINSERITIPAASGGCYIISGQVSFAANNTGRRELHIYKNNAAFAVAKEFSPHATEVTTLQVVAEDTASGGDYYDLRVYQNSTGALDVNSGVTATFFNMVKVT